MPGVSGVGYWPTSPGQDGVHTQQMVFEAFAALPAAITAIPFIAHPGQHRGQSLLSTAVTCLAGLPVEVGPHGWKLADRPGMDQRAALGMRREELLALGVAGHGYSGPLSITMAGPWTLVRRLYLARGDVVLSDRGAVSDVIAAYGLGLADLVAEYSQQVPGAELTMVLLESDVGAVLAGRVPTFSGYSRIAAVDGPRVMESLQTVVDHLHAARAQVVVDDITTQAIAPAVLAGADAIGLRLPPWDPAGPWDEAGWQTVARAMEKGAGLWAGGDGQAASASPPSPPHRIAQAVAGPWRRIGLPAADLDKIVLSASFGPYPASPDSAHKAVADLGRAAEILGEEAQ